MSLVVATLGLLTGCAAGRGKINITDNLAQATTVTLENGKVVVIENVVDSRVFEASPKDPSHPSIDPDNNNLDEIQGTLIARKRDGWGRAFGDIVTHDGITVQKYFRGLVTNALANSGYIVVNKSDDPNAIHMQVDVKQFWGWLSPGFWTVAVSTRTELEITAVKNQKQVVIKMLQEDTSRGMKASTSNWTHIFKVNAEKVRDVLTKDFKEKLPTLDEASREATSATEVAPNEEVGAKAP